MLRKAKHEIAMERVVGPGECNVVVTRVVVFVSFTFWDDPLSRVTVLYI